MTTKTISNAVAYAAGYTLDGSYDTISLTSAGYVGGTGITGGKLSAYAIRNDGSIAGTDAPHGIGVGLYDGGSVVNLASASITGANVGIGSGFGVHIKGAAGTVVNYGSITGYSEGVILYDGGSVSNMVSASITAGHGVGVYIGGLAGTVINSGKISSGYSDGVFLDEGGSVANMESGSIAGSHGAGVGIFAAAGTVVNYGSISSGYLEGVYLEYGGSVTNAASASIIGGRYGVYVGFLAVGTVVNDGSVSGGSNDGVGLSGGGSVTNAASASITGGNDGVYVGFHGAGTVVNDGTIAGASAFGVALYDGGSVTNAASGTITGGEYGVRFQTIAGPVVNYGVIDGGTYSVGFDSTGGVLEVEAGSKLIGEASGDGSTLEFGSGSGAGTVSGLGSGTLSGSAGSFAIADFTTYEVAADAAWTLTNANTIASGDTLDVSGSLNVDGDLLVDGALSGSGSIDVAGGTLDLGVAIGSADLGFSGFGLIELTQDGTYTGIGIDGMAEGDTIALLSQVYASGDYATYSSGTIVLFNSEGTVLDSLSVTSPESYYQPVVVDDGGKVAIETISCFLPGTRILTPNGEVPIEELERGSMVTTVEGNSVPVRWLGRQTVSTKFGDPLRVLPIRIKAGAIAENVPTRDLLCSADHAFLIDGVLIQAHALVNGVTIVRERNVPEIFTLYHIECDSHELILAEGFAAETFVDNVDRLGFDNWDEHQALYPQGKPIVEMSYPRAKAARQVPLAVREGLAQRAGICVAA